MTQRALVSQSSQTPVSNPGTAELEQYIEEYMLHCEYQHFALSTIKARRVFLKNLIWFLKQRSLADACEFSASGWSLKRLSKFLH